MKIYTVYLVSGIFFDLLIKKTPLSASLVLNVLILRDIPQYSEFLIAFSLMILVGLVFFSLWIRLFELKGIWFLLWIITWVIIVQLWERSGWMNIFNGPEAFPVFSYMPLFFIGGYFSKNKILYNRNLLIMMTLITIIGAICQYSYPQFMTRFPPDPLWIFSSLSIIYTYYLFSSLVEHNYTGLILSFIGRNALSYFLISNLSIFILRTKLNFSLHYFGSAITTLFIILGTTLYLLLFGHLKEKFLTLRK